MYISPLSHVGVTYNIHFMPCSSYIVAAHLLFYRDFALPSKMAFYNIPSSKKKAYTTLLRMASEEEEEQVFDYAVLVLGAMGVGKSTLCNFFFGEDIFTSVSGMIRGTSEFHAHCCLMNGKRVLLIDSPGFADTTISDKDRMQQLGKALLLARNGVHAILVCVNGEGRFSKDDECLLNEMKKLEINEPLSIWSYTFVLFTHGRSMGKTDIQANEKLRSWRNDSKCPPLFTELLHKVQNRYMIVESLMDERKDYHTQKCDQFVQFIEKIYADNNKACYTHRLFAWARSKYEEAMKKEVEKGTIQNEELIKNHVEMLKNNQDLIIQLENDKFMLSTKVHEIENALHEAEMQLKDNEHVINQKTAEITAMQKNETIKIQDALHNLEKSKEEQRKLQEIIEKRQKECREKNRIIQTKQTEIDKEIQSKINIEEQLRKEQQAKIQFEEKAKKLLHDKQIEGDPETLTEALDLMTKEIDHKEHEIQQLTQHIESSAVLGISIPFTNKRLVILDTAQKNDVEKQSSKSENEQSSKQKDD